jgi:predicted nucleic acid-binding protein
MEPAILGLVLDFSIIIEAERQHQTVEEFLNAIQQQFGEIEITMSAIALAELVHGIARANTPERRDRPRAFIDELKKHVSVHLITDATAEIAGTIGGEQAAKGNTIPIDDLLIGSSAIEQGYAAETARAVAAAETARSKNP